MYKPDMKEYEKNYCVYAEERAGKSGTRFFRRSFPFAEGILKEENGFYLKGENGETPALQTKAIEKYKDGSIKWLSVAFSTKLDAYAKVRFDGVFKKRTDKEAPLSTDSKDKIVLKNDGLTVTINKEGFVESIVKDKKELLGKNGIRVSITTEDKKAYLENASAEIYVQGSVYTVVRIKGDFPGTNVNGDWFITFYKDDSRLSQKVKFITEGDSILLSEAIEIDYADDMKDFGYCPRCEKKGNLIFTETLTAGGEIVMSSKDPVRFKTAVASTGVHNGFAIEDGVVIYSPIQCGTAFLWPDGVGRTIHLETSFEKATEDAVSREIKWDYEPPFITIPSKWFVAAGIIEDDTQSEAVSRNAVALESLYGFYWGHFEAGMLPNSLAIDHTTKKFHGEGKMHRSNGEVPYTLLRTYMCYGRPKMYDLMMDYVEHWMDIIQYRGMHKALHGANRYHSGDFFNDHQAFCTSMPYYGDPSGLYMAYCVTGDPFIGECFKQAIDFLLEDVEKNGTAILSYWTEDMFGVHQSPEFQTRCSIVTRVFNFAHNLYNDERYLEAGKSIMRWMAKAQNENGSFYEDYYYDTFKPDSFPLANGEYQPLEKQYIMTFGSRGYSEFACATKDETTIKVLERLCDYYVEAMDDLGFMWYPNHVDEKANDGGGWFQKRGSCGATTGGTMYTLAYAYHVLPKKEYLIGALKAARYCISMWGCDGSAGQLTGSQSPFLQGAQAVSRLIKENREFAIENGFADVVALLDTDTKETFGKYPAFNHRYRRFGINTYDTKYGEAITLLHRLNAVHGWNTHVNKAFDFEMELCSDGKLWYGCDNVVTMNSDKVGMKKEVRVVELMSLLKTNIGVSALTGESTVKILKYTEDELVMDLSGSGVDVTVEDGLFRVIDGAQYSIEQRDRDCTVTAKDGKLKFNMRPVIGSRPMTIKRIK